MLRRLICIRIAICAIVLGAAAWAQVPSQGTLQVTSQVRCTASAQPAVVRAEGRTELIGDIVLTCTGGVPTSAGRNVPSASLQVALNTRVTSRVLANSLSEAMLLIDDPKPGSQFPCATAACGAVAGQPLGPGPRENRNIYQGVPLDASLLLWRSFPLDPPGSATRILRLKNIRMDAASLGSNLTAAPGALLASVSLSGQAVTSTRSVLTVGFPQSGVSASVLDAAGGAATAPLLLPVAPGVNSPLDANSNVNFLVQFQEGFASSFRKRNAATSVANPAAVGDQADPSALFNTESGFYNSSFVAVSGQNLAGLADQGTRLMAVFSGIPPGVSLYVTTSAAAASGSSVISAGLVAVDGNGAGPANLISSKMTLAGGAGIAPLTIVNGTAAAVWEIFDTDPSVIESIRFGVVVSYTTVASGTANVSGALAPSASTNLTNGPEPSFAPGANSQPAFTISTNASIPAITTTPPLATGQKGTPYSQPLTATGGAPPYSWAIRSGTLPTGLSLDAATGLVSGIPAVPGTWSSVIAVIDAVGLSSSKNFSISITDTRVQIMTPSPLAAGTVGAPYSQMITLTGGTPPYGWSISGGALPSGLSLNAASGAISGTPITAGASAFTVRVADSFSAATKDLSITIKPPSINITTASPLPPGLVATGYMQTFSASGGVSPYSWSIANGAVPTGLTLSGSGVLSGNPSKAGSFALDVRVADSAGASAVKSFNITVTPQQLSILNTSLPDGSMGAAYSQTVSASGGTPPYTWSISSGALPAGLALNAANGVISGTPSAPGAAAFTVTVADQNGQSVSKPFTLTINGPPPPSITTPSLPDGVPSTSYSATLTATGGSGSYTWSVAGGALPSGLSLNTASGVISGTPVAAGASAFTVRVADSFSAATKDLSITVKPPPINITTASPLPPGLVATGYTQTFSASGGVPPYSWSITNGAAPPGLALSSSGVLSGNPSKAGSFALDVRVADSAGASAVKSFNITVTPQQLSIVNTSLPDGSTSAAYSQTVSASGGTPPYTWSISSGALPAGLALNAATGVISGTTAVAGAASFTVRVTDAASAATERAFGVTFAAGLRIGACPPASATVGQPYTSALTGSGGAPPYAWSVTGGALPPGLSLNSDTGTLAGTPAQTGSFTFTLVIADRSTSNFKDCTLSVRETLLLSPSSLPGGTENARYLQNLTASGGIPPYTWSIASGSLPPGLAFNASGQISGAPTRAGLYSFVMRATDSGGLTADLPLTIRVLGAPSIGACPADPVSVAQVYSFTFTAAGGVPPYTWSVASGALPPGMSLGATDGLLRGTPPNTGTFRFDVLVQDNAGVPATRSCSVTVTSGPLITTQSLPAGTVRRPYTQPLTATGGRAPYRWSLTRGQLPAGLTLDPATGQIAGTPAVSGTFQVTVQVTDAASQAASHDYTLTAVDVLTITTTVLPKARLGLPYQGPIEAAGGALPYAWTISAGALPNGLALDSAGNIKGAPLAPGSYDFAVQVTDGARGIVIRPLRLDVELQMPAASPTNLPPVADPAQQLSLSLALDSPYPADLHGQVALDFAPDSENPQDDRMVQFSTGGRNLSFTFPQGATAAALPQPNVAVLSGTVSGTITLRFSVFAGDAPIIPSPWPDVLIRVDRRPPVITSISLEKTASGFDVTVTGYSTTREITQAAFAFEPAASGNLGTAVLRPEVAPAFRKWYTDPASSVFGSQFRFTQSFTVNGDPTAIGSISVTLENQKGPSAPAKIKL